MPERKISHTVWVMDFYPLGLCARVCEDLVRILCNERPAACTLGVDMYKRDGILGGYSD